MKDKFDKLRIVVLESPFDTWDNSLVRSLFNDMIGTKLRGYGRQYPYGVLPVDGADLISTHLMLCHRDSLRPIMAIRWTSLKKCKKHFLNFPALSLVQQARAPEHIEAMQEIIRQAESNEVDLYYSGALTIEPSERKDKEWSIFCREILTMMYVHYQRENPHSELLAGGTVRFKIDQWLESLGHHPLSNNKSDLGPIQVFHLAGEVVRVMHLKSFSFEAFRLAKKWSPFWQDRLVISPSTEVSTKKAA